MTDAVRHEMGDALYWRKRCEHWEGEVARVSNELGRSIAKAEAQEERAEEAEEAHRMAEKRAQEFEEDVEACRRDRHKAEEKLERLKKEHDPFWHRSFKKAEERAVKAERRAWGAEGREDDAHNESMRLEEKLEKLEAAYIDARYGSLMAPRHSKTALPSGAGRVYETGGPGFESQRARWSRNRSTKRFAPLRRFAKRFLDLSILAKMFGVRQTDTGGNEVPAPSVAPHDSAISVLQEPLDPPVMQGRLAQLKDISNERRRQDKLKAEGRFTATCADPISNDRRLSILVEEVGEVARASLGQAGAVQDGGNLRKELVQVAAIALAWIEGIDRESGR